MVVAKRPLDIAQGPLGVLAEAFGEAHGFYTAALFLIPATILINEDSRLL